MTNIIQLFNDKTTKVLKRFLKLEISSKIQKLGKVKSPLWTFYVIILYQSRNINR